MIKRMSICLLGVGSLLLLGCVRQDAWLSYNAVDAPLPTATVLLTPEPTAAPESLAFDPVTGEDFETDRNGIPILSADTHYFTYYLSFSRVRIYEEEGYTYLDGVCTNAFSTALTGRANVYFYDQDEKLVGYGVLHTADSQQEMNLPVGESRLYAEILSEVDVQQATCVIEQAAAFHPL